MLKDRLRECTDIAGSGDALARKAAIPRRTLETYLSGESEPKASRIEAIAKATGVNGHWLLTGEGPMLLKDVGTGAPGGPLDLPKLQLAIETVEEGLASTGRIMRPAKKAELVLAVYDFFTGSQGQVDKGVVLRLVKSAS